jgi:hypothetical protein
MFQSLCVFNYKLEKLSICHFCLITFTILKLARKKCIASTSRVYFFFKIFVPNIFYSDTHLAIYTRNTCIFAENLPVISQFKLSD